MREAVDSDEVFQVIAPGFGLYKLPESGSDEVSAIRLTSAIAAQMRTPQFKGINDAVPCGNEIGISFDSNFDPQILNQLDLSLPETKPAKRVQIPILYRPTDEAKFAASHLGITVETLFQVHQSAVYTCYAVGFCPGFAYLTGLPEAITGVPRLPVPRVRTAAGSLGITGKQTAVYPSERPGGWPIIGITPLEIVNLENLDFRILVGDEVEFYGITESDFSDFFNDRDGSEA